MPSIAAHSATRPLRVALINYRDDAAIGGSLRVMEGLGAHLDPQRIEAHFVFAYGGPGPVAERAIIPCHFLRASGPREVAAWLRGRRLMETLQPDVLHFHTPVYWLQAAIAGLGCKKLLHVHGPVALEKMTWAQRLAWQVARRFSHGQICLTESMKSQLLSGRLANSESICTIHNGIDFDHFNKLPNRDIARARLRLPRDSFVLGFVSRLVWWKGAIDALRVMKCLGNHFHLVFCGSGPDQRHLEEEARALGVFDRVHFTGVLNDTRQAYAAIDCLLFLSRYEPFGLVVAEAMAAGVPVFGLGGDGDYRDRDYPLITADTACLVERRNPKDYASPESEEVISELASRLVSLASDPASFASMISRARERIRSMFDLRKSAEITAQLYERVAQAGAGSLT